MGRAGEVASRGVGPSRRRSAHQASSAVSPGNSYTQQHICCEQYFSKVTACFINVDQSHYLRVRMSFTGFPDDQPEDGERLTSAASSSNKVKLSTNRRQKEKLMLAAANQKARSVIECSGDLEMLPTEARLSTTPATSSSITSSPVKLKISGDSYLLERLSLSTRTYTCR